MAFDLSVDNYIEEICRYIKWKRCHFTVKQELRSHLYEHIDELIADGMTETEATDLAIREMGEPQLIGNELNQIYKAKLDMTLIIPIITILIINLYFVLLNNQTQSLLKAVALLIFGIFICFVPDSFEDSKQFMYAKKVFLIVLISFIFCVVFILGIEPGSYSYIFLAAPYFWIYQLKKVERKGVSGMIYISLVMNLTCFLCLTMGNYSLTLMILIAAALIYVYAFYYNWSGGKRSIDIVVSATIFSVAAGYALYKKSNSLPSAIFFEKEIFTEINYIFMGKMGVCMIYVLSIIVILSKLVGITCRQRRNINNLVGMVITFLLTFQVLGVVFSIIGISLFGNSFKIMLLDNGVCSVINLCLLRVMLNLSDRNTIDYISLYISQRKETITITDRGFIFNLQIPERRR